MIHKGRVSSLDAVRRVARITFADLDDSVTPELPYADHVTLEVGDEVAVALFSDSLADGLIIAVRGG
ncbi:hypothetical protein [Gorillibacterium sp. sgz5001074]|uniref:hypothetical protein n=1 Tax=Gorillibacterium sp. sgz5001074 TaxID=3446695 RepID=UPI003F6747BA